ncbi:hypothetical protein MAHJHV55_47400 [Mycobacterium avium subsp. hominissuis]
MDFGLTGEQEQLASAERSWLDRNDPIARLRQTLDAAPITLDPAAATHAAQTGLLGLLTSDVGGTHLDLAVCSEAHGYAASSLPLADMAIGAWLLEKAGIEEMAEAAEGQLLVGVARADAPVSGPVSMAADMDAFAVVRQTVTSRGVV